MRRPIIIAAAIAIAAAGATAAAATAGHDDDAAERAITGDALDRAKAAALADTPGEVTETEAGDEDSYYEVEVTLDDGSQVDVQLDRDFRVVSSEGDSEGDEG